MGASAFADFTSRHDPGEILFQAGDEGTTLFVVQSGRIELVDEGGATAEVLAVMEKGDFFGEMSLLEGGKRPFTARVIETAQVIEIGPALFDRMIRSNIELAVRMLRKLSLRLHESEARVAQMARVRMPAPEPAPPVRATPRADTPAAAGERSRPVPAPRRPEPPPPQPGEAPSLLHLAGGACFTLASPTTRVGRFDPVTGTRPEVDLTLLDLKRSVSRRHALFTVSDSGVELAEEVGALNGTTINGRTLSPGEPVAVHDGDTVGFGGVELLFRAPAAGQTSGTT